MAITFFVLYKNTTPALNSSCPSISYNEHDKLMMAIDTRVHIYLLSEFVATKMFLHRMAKSYPPGSDINLALSSVHN